MNDDQLLRYSRHILLREIDVSGQQSILNARVLVVGAGGLGSPVLLYLAASGVGHITVCDDDNVDLSNLQRQIAHHSDAIGRNKAESAASAMRAINPDITVQALTQRLSGVVLAAQVAAADVVIDASDNFATRHAVNRACVEYRKPLVSGAAIGFDGQVTVFDLRHTNSPCYHCLYPDTGSSDEMRCAENGVFSPLVGIIGTVQAAEALKLICSAGESLNGRLLLLDALNMQWRSIRLQKDTGCVVCGGIRC
ncbi:sulfur carrier protein adenylyltransferase ThiF [Sulfuriferula multivorans]|uniref:Molybdopterin-synthase adenylyltransferase n=1 Tax=Sulfuriferula multivorans TaxID=1559896 RepID=A0A401JH79_9PROT|nr:molybdopterin-synthase adenylyltransferase MoeB [Sulfuriferula multivorans]GBL47312.1 sulfur carrier protein adenylyltransferase ThiF [Sulfuriferula multivorans]